MKHEAELVTRMSFKAAEVASAAARSVSEMKKDDRNFAERADAAQDDRGSLPEVL